jgi:hypothetical protein
MVLEAPQPFHPSTILQRQQQLTPSNLPSMAPAQVPVAFDRRGTMQADQKAALMSFFDKTAGLAQHTASPVQQQPQQQQSQQQQQPRRRVSQSGSPVSPIPDRRVPVNARGAGGVAPRSRMSSFADEGKANGSGPHTPIDAAEKKFLLGYLENFVSKGT